jgi:hypothetical protein
MRNWINYCKYQNVAVVLGKATAGIFAIDIDVTNKYISEEIWDIAERVLGKTPFIRQGMFPKLLLLYRSDDEIKSKSYTLDIEDRKHAIEILGAGKMVTILGLHHKTGMNFKWLDSDTEGQDWAYSPLTQRPEMAPTTTQEKVTEFLEAVFEKYPAYKVQGMGSSSCVIDLSANAEGIAVPKLQDSDEWVTSEGKIIDGREKFITSLVYRTVQANLSEIKSTKDIDDLRSRITVAVIKEFIAKCQTDYKWNQNSIKHNAGIRVNHLINKLNNGEIEIHVNIPEIIKTIDGKWSINSELRQKLASIKPTKKIDFKKYF